MLCPKIYACVIYIYAWTFSRRRKSNGWRKLNVIRNRLVHFGVNISTNVIIYIKTNPFVTDELKPLKESLKETLSKKKSLKETKQLGISHFKIRQKRKEEKIVHLVELFHKNRKAKVFETHQLNHIIPIIDVPTYDDEGYDDIH